MDPHQTESDADAASHSARLTDLIRAEIAAAADGLLPFDRFMELALYAPGLGYYVAGATKFGAGGDFVTAPEVSPLFGRCVAVQAAQALERLNGGEVLEFGAGSGALAVAVLTGLEQLGALPQRYLILEPSPGLQERQRALLAARVPHLAGRCHWLDRLPERVRGVVLANEVLDAMPVHRFRIGAAGEPLEVFVTAADGVLSEVAAPVRSPRLAAAITELQAAGLAQAPGYASEVNLRLNPWCAALGECLTAGLVLLIDYGYPASAYYQPDRSMGTLMCHWRHQAHGDPYRHLGLQDIGAHVDFSAAARAGQAAGLTLAGFATQAHFLIGCGIDRFMADAAGAGTAGMDLIAGAKQLLLPAAMGERFKVLGLSRGLAGPWCGFSVRDLQDRL
ncbi:SAM-dependent methyltransferase [uncultured Thiodictyon sp.]|uniref:class I SAM-dependent methyltransferase n=1 Tax=uncultured Thiodictyon sp. TaxID=1846217 RepID=UPI0025F65B77|nr:SAM-dependent methyltransferase [uncultured Thiodictyon sp.]